MHIEVHANYFVHIIKTNYIHYYIKRVNLELHLSNNFIYQCKRLLKKSRNHVKTIEDKVELCGFSFFTGIERYPIGY